MGAAGFEAAERDREVVGRSVLREIERARNPETTIAERASISPPIRLGVIDALALALERASAAGEWGVVAQLAGELQARRLEADGVVSIATKRGAR